MNLASVAAAIVAPMEGCRLSAYQDSGGVWTIAYGHTGGVKAGDTCTPEKALAWLAEDMAHVIPEIPVGLPILSSAAMVSFGYNCGIGALRRYLISSIEIMTMTRQDNGSWAQDPNGIPTWVAKDASGNWVPYGYVDAHGVRQAGLIARRTLEATLILASRLTT